MPRPIVYDKMKYHLETVEENDLPEAHAFHHTAYFLRWLIEHSLISEEFAEDLRGVVAIEDLIGTTDGCLIDDMLTPEGNRFTAAYFDFERGKFLKDYEACLGGGLPTLFHISFTDKNFRKLSIIIDQRYAAWKKAKR